MHMIAHGSRDADAARRALSQKSGTDIRLISEIGCRHLQQPRRLPHTTPLVEAARIHCTVNSVVLGRPRRLPDDRARSSPASTRSLIIARSNSLTTPSTPNSARPDGSKCPVPAGAGTDRCRGIIARPANRSGLAGIVPTGTLTMPPRCRTRAGQHPSTGHPVPGCFSRSLAPICPRLGRSPRRSSRAVWRSPGAAVTDS
jgi:hypothetical protein